MKPMIKIINFISTIFTFTILTSLLLSNPHYGIANHLNQAVLLLSISSPSSPSSLSSSSSQKLDIHLFTSCEPTSISSTKAWPPDSLSLLSASPKLPLHLCFGSPRAPFKPQVVCWMQQLPRYLYEGRSARSGEGELHFHWSYLNCPSLAEKALLWVVSCHTYRFLLANPWFLSVASVFGFLLGSSLAGAAVYYYILDEYKVSNELLTEDIYVRYCI